MIELRTLGTVVLRDSKGEDIHAVLSQPKRVALLAYLAIARPLGFHRRDTLLALLWPELDEQHARWALNQALQRLRNALGKEVVCSRGDGEVGIAPGGHLWSDVVEFESAIEADRLAEALSLYRGDLLQGFHVSDCGEFERWLEEERTRLRRRAAQAAASLAEREGSNGAPVAAGHWARQALALSPDNEEEARRLIQLLDRIGDRAGAVQAYEEFAHRLREEYEVEPAPETRALIESVRARRFIERSPSPSLEESTNGHPPAPLGQQPVVVEPAAVVVEGALQRAQRWKTVVALSALLLVVVAAALWGPSRSLDASRARSPATTIAVLPFGYRGNPELAYLGEGMVDLLGANLNGAGEIHTVDPRAVLAMMRRVDSARGELEQARTVAQRLNAGWYLLGDVVEGGGRLRITARLQPAHAEFGSPTEATVEGLPTELFRLVDGLTIRLLQQQGLNLGTPAVNLAGATTDSLAALKTYLKAERAYRTGRVEPAIEMFQRATTIDSTFALAHYRLGIITALENRLGLAQAAGDKALRHSQRVGEADRKLILALVACVHGRSEESRRLFREILTRYPDNIEAWYLLGIVTRHWRGSIPGSWLDSREQFEHVLSLDPSHQAALWNLSNIAAREGNRAELGSLTDRLLRLDLPPYYQAVVRGQRAIVLGDAAQLVQSLAAIREADDQAAHMSAGILAFVTGDLAAGRRLWRLMTDPARPRGLRYLAHKTLAHIELMSGRWRSAQLELDTMAAMEPATALEHRALFSLWPLQRLPRTDLLALRDSLFQWRAVPGARDETLVLAEHSPAHPYLRLYLLGLIDARLGDYSAAWRSAAELDRRARWAFAPEFVTDLARTVRAEVARARGEPEAALRLLEQASFWSAVEQKVTGDSPFFAHEYERFLRAELLSALGRNDEALRWFRERADDRYHSGAPAHVRMAEIYDRSGNSRQAAAHYTRFVELWKDADPELRPLVEEARRHLTGSDPRSAQAPMPERLPERMTP